MKGDCGSNGIENNKNIIIELEAELNDILLNHKLTLQKIDELTVEVAAREAARETIELSLLEGQRIASEMEAEADIRVRAIMANAQQVIQKNKEHLSVIENEIDYLNKELNPGYVVIEGAAPQPEELAAASSVVQEAEVEQVPDKAVKVNIREDKPVKNEGNEIGTACN
jgi:hypothetical protein